MADADLVSLLESVSLGHLSTPLTGKSLSVLQSELAEKGRPAFLSDLKAIGVDKLPERQKLATTNSQGRARCVAGGPGLNDRIVTSADGNGRYRSETCRRLQGACARAGRIA